MAEQKVLIVGAGICGLLIAQGLKQHGIPFEIFEKGSHAHSRDWAVTLGWARCFMQSLLPASLHDRLHEVQVNPHHPLDSLPQDIVIRNGETGDILRAFVQPGATEMSIKRAKMLFSEGIDVQQGRTLKDISINSDTATVTAFFEDGTSASGTTLVSAEGGSSITRRFLFGEKAMPVELPYAMMNFTCTYPAQQAKAILTRLHPLVEIGIHDKGMYMRLNRLEVIDEWKPETIKFQILTTWRQDDSLDETADDSVRVQILKEKVADWVEPYRSAIQWLPENIKIPVDKLKYWRPARWDNHGGRVTMAGDSAHASTFHRGQGANNAIRDAYEFVSAMVHVRQGTSLTDAINAYENEVVKRGATEVDISNAQTNAMHDLGLFWNSPAIKFGAGPSTMF